MKRPENRTAPIEANPAYAWRANSLPESPAVNPNFRAEKMAFPELRNAPFPRGNPRLSAPKNGDAFQKNSLRPARTNSNAPPKGKLAPPEPSAKFKPRHGNRRDSLRNRIYRRPPTAPEYAFGLFPKRRRLSWRTGGWRNILRRARRAPRKRGRPFAG